MKPKNPEKLSFLSLKSIDNWIKDLSRGEDYCDLFLSNDYVDILIYLLRCDGNEESKSQSIRIISRIFEEFPYMIDVFINRGFKSTFISIIKDLYVHDICNNEWSSIILIVRFVFLMSSKFRDELVEAGTIDSILPYCKHYMFSVACFVSSLFPPFSVEPSVQILKSILPAFECFLKINPDMYLNLTFNCLMSSRLNDEHVAEMIKNSDMMTYLEGLRDSDTKRTSRKAFTIVNSIFAETMFEDALWIFNDQ